MRPPSAPASQSVGINFGSGASVNGGEFVGRDKITYGLTTEDVAPRLDAILAAVQAEKGVPLEVLQQVLSRFGEAEVLLGPAQIEHRLRAKADEYHALRQRLARLSNDDPRVGRLRREAGDLIGASRFDEADTVLAEAERLDLESVEELETLTKRRRLSAAESRAERGAAARLRLAYREAAVHYEMAASIVPPRDADIRLGYTLEQASALRQRGEEFGDNQALLDAIEVYRSVLSLLPREQMPLQWAQTQNSLGNALQALGEREGGTARLEKAIVAYKAALKERRRKRVPLEWAQTQNNLGLVLWKLGEREGDTGRLKQAVAAYRAALEERRRELLSFNWATTQNNLGLALWRLGELESGTGQLKRAAAAFLAAQEVWTRELLPLRWATAQNNLGLVLQALGEREDGTARLEEAIVAYRAALEERGRERVPLQWAQTQTNIGIALRILGERISGTVHFEEAIASFREALEERTRERVPLDWAMSTGNQGVTLMLVAERLNDATRAKGAVEQIEIALTTMRDGGNMPAAAYFEAQLPRALALASQFDTADD